MKDCVWHVIYIVDEQIVLEQGLTAAGLISIILGLWLNFILIGSKFRSDRSYGILGNFIFIALVRRIIVLILNLPFFKYLQSANGLEAECCEFFAFIETFLAVLEVECLTHVCIERYVVAKYITNGWTITDNHYRLFLVLCFIFALTYSLPPLFGLGYYGYDFTCTTCTFDMMLPLSWDKYFIVTLFMLRSIKPIVVMISMLCWTKMLEQKYDCSEKSRDLVRFTNCVVKVTSLNIICWAPIAAIRGWVILSQVLFTEPNLVVPAFYIQWAMWIHWVTPAVTVIAMFVVDHRVHAEMMFSGCKDEDHSQIPNKCD